MTTRYRARLRALRDEAAALLGAVWTFALRADVPTLAASFAFSAIFAIGPLLSLTLIGLSMLPGEMFRRGLDHVARAVVRRRRRLARRGDERHQQARARLHPFGSGAAPWPTACARHAPRQSVRPST